MKLFFLLISIFLSSLVFGQQDNAWKLVQTFRGEIASATADHLDNLYVISGSGQIRKLNAKGDSVAVYNQQRNYGTLSSIDVSNPLKILLFYKDFSTLVVLDRWLAQRSVIDLRRHNILQPSAIALSYDNLFWVFDEYDNKLKKIDEQGNLLLETPDLRSFFPEVISPHQLLNENGMVYLADAAKGVFIFDSYGSFKKRLGIRIPGKLSSINGNVLFATADRLSIHDPSTFRETSIAFPRAFTNYTNSAINGRSIVLWNDEELAVYRFNFK